MPARERTRSARKAEAASEPPGAPWSRLFGREVSPAEATEAASNLLEFFRVAIDWSLAADAKGSSRPRRQPVGAEAAEPLP